MDERTIEETKAEIEKRLMQLQHYEKGSAWGAGYMEGVRSAFKVLQERVFKATPEELADGDFYLGIIPFEKEWFEEMFRDYI